MKLMQTGEVNISFIHDIETSLFITQLIQHVYVMYFSIGYQYDCRYGSLYIIQGMKFDASFVFPKFRPPKNIQTKVYGGGIKGINITVNFHLEVIFVVAITGFRNQGISKFFVDTIISIPVCFPQIGTANCCTESQVIVLALVCLKAEHKLTHTISGGQLSENHAQHLIPTGECSDFLIPGILLYQTVKATTGKKICKLSEDIFALVHCF